MSTSTKSRASKLATLGCSVVAAGWIAHKLFVSSPPTHTNHKHKMNQRIGASVEIKTIELYEVYIPLVNVYHISCCTLKGHTNIICKITTNNDQIFGFGEASPLTNFTDETIESVMDITQNKIFPLIKGLNPTKINEIDKIMDSKIDDNNIIAKGMINMALWDIYGKYYDKPVYQCLAEIYNNNKVVNREMPLIYGIGDQTMEEDLKMIEYLWGQGINFFF